MAILNGMPALMKKTGHGCPKNCRRFCWYVLHLRWQRGQPRVDEDLFDERLRAYNNGTLDDLLRNARKK